MRKKPNKRQSWLAWKGVEGGEPATKPAEKVRFEADPKKGNVLAQVDQYILSRKK
jgi:hypothetical protein